MIILIILLSMFIILFEVSFIEIVIFSNVSFIFIIVNLFFWSKRYDIAIWCGMISGILIDLVLQKHLGETIFSLFFPLLILSFFDSLLRIESKLSRVIFSLTSTASSIFILDFLFKLVFLNSTFTLGIVVKRIVISVIVLLFLSMLIGNVLLSKRNGSKFS